MNRIAKFGLRKLQTSLWYGAKIFRYLEPF